MTVTCRICGETFETPDAPTEATEPVHPGCRSAPAELGYRSDLQALVARSRRSVPITRRDESEYLDVPPSVREAIRQVDELLPRPAPQAPAPAPRMRLTALPVIALAVAGVVLGAPLGPKRGSPPAPRRIEAAVPDGIVVEALSRPPPPAGAVVIPTPPARPLPVAPQAPPSIARPLARSPGLASKPRPAPTAVASSAPAPSAAPPEPPSLMDAITEAVRTRSARPDRP